MLRARSIWPYFDGSFQPKAGSAFALEKQGAGYLLKHMDGTAYAFDGPGNVTSIEKPDRDRITYEYSGGRTVSVSNASGTLIFTYGADGNIAGVGRTAMGGR